MHRRGAAAGGLAFLCLLAGCSAPGGSDADGGPPHIAAVVPDSGLLAGGETVEVTGRGLDSGVTVHFGGVPATVLVATPRRVRVLTPAQKKPGSVRVVVTTALGRDARDGAFAYHGMTITRVDPAVGPAGSSVVVHGSCFPRDGVRSVDPLASFEVVSSTQIRGRLAPGAAGRVVDVVVHGVGGERVVLSGGFRYAAPRRQQGPDPEEVSNAATSPAPRVPRPQPPAGETSSRALVFGDVDGDGRRDRIEIIPEANALELRRGRAGGGYGRVRSLPVAPGPECLALGDLDGDGDLDLVVAHRLGPDETSDRVSVFRNAGRGALEPAGSPSLSGKGPCQLILSDVTGDGRTDLLALNEHSQSVSLLRGRAGGSLAPARCFSLGCSPSAFALHDLGSPEGRDAAAALAPDGRADLVIADAAEDSVRIFYNGVGGQAAGEFTRGERYPLDGLISAEETRRAGGIGAAVLPRKGVGPCALAVADLNGDGAPEIVTADAGTHTLTVLHANAANAPLAGLRSSSHRRKFTLPRDYRLAPDTRAIGAPRVVLPLDHAPELLQVADLNQDGFPDLVAGRYAGPERTRLFNAGRAAQGTHGGAGAFPVVLPAGEVVLQIEEGASGFPRRP